MYQMHHRFARFFLLMLLAISFVAPDAQADVKLPSILGSNMVLQREMQLPIWGWADKGEDVTVTFAGQKKTATTGDDGKWIVKLDKLPASAKGETLTIEGKNKIELTDILVGEVWICSGQSNMEWSINASLNPKEEVAASDYPLIRLYNVPAHLISPVPNDNCPGDWKVCSPKTSGGFSAVGYHFGKRLHKELNVPIGLVGSNWGGTRIEPWTTLDGFKSVPELANIAEQVEKIAAEQSKVGNTTPAAISNAMILPLAPFAMRGAIWYQGESNGGEGISYHHKKMALINGWRKLFNPDLAFYWVQLADFQAPNDDPAGGNGWAKLREAQRKSLEIKHTGMAVIIDIGDAKDIHPRNKQDVGHRLSQWALHQTYGKKELVPSGPLYKGIKVEGDSIRVSFDHTGSGLIVGEKTGLDPVKEIKDGKLARFAIAGEDKKWFWANATIDGDTIVVKSADVPKPVAVRYAYSMNPKGANLYNKEGIPASPFRSDDW